MSVSTCVLKRANADTCQSVAEHTAAANGKNKTKQKKSAKESRADLVTQGGENEKLTDKEEKARLRVVKEENWRIKYVSASKSSASYEPLQEDSSSTLPTESEDFPTLIESSEPGTSKSVMRKDFITPTLVAALDRCQLSMRDSLFILEATIDGFRCNIDGFPISKSSIQRIRTEKRKERAEYIKIDFQNEVPDVVTLHWDGKLLPALSARKSKEERLPTVISYGLKNNSFLCRDRIILQAKNRHKLFGRRS
ncbi:hypothetical protein AVEN_219955-1 [Araneus ventricosus]|uniref:Uncharacterized protein n=1 Tax=Araneus ventricosus TaxID=182803 RepID=A0A4Y2TNV9_ARAVE|nr:hypothetical protein AVEN_219955-1 [Araneus ventricosus]